MCGIVGIWDFKDRIEPSLLESIRDRVQHRGPDDRGLYIDDEHNVGLGHQRLSILDPSPAGHQPMGFDGLWTVHNGEIYNFKEIRRQLLDKGHAFASESDTEVILRGYREWGIEMVERFRGMFATALWDKKDATLTIVRDRAGVKPLYYYYDDELFVFGSELKAVVQHPSVGRTIDFDALALYLKFGYVPAPFSIFKNVSKLEAGSVLTLNADRKLRTRQYWNVTDYYPAPSANGGPDTLDEETRAAELEKILLDSFQLRMVSDVPVGVFLSGGIDSSIVTALLQKNSTQQIKTFTIGFEDGSYNEAKHAKEVAAHLGTDHHELYCTPKNAMEIIPKLPEIYDEPFGDASGIPTYLLSKFAREHVKVALSADGGDEIFAGYNHHAAIAKAYNLFLRLGISKRQAVWLMQQFPLKQIAGRKVDNVELKLKKLSELASKNRSALDFFFVGRSLWPEAEVARLLNRRSDVFGDFLDSFGDLGAQVDGFTNLMRVADYKTYMVDDILVKVDRATMATGLEGRDPLLDQNIVQFCARLPENYLMRDGTTKYLLKQILYKYVPRELVDRPKMGFGVPLDIWLKNDLRHLVHDYLNESVITRGGIFDWNIVRREIEDFMSGKMTSSSRMWLLLEFEMWREKWVGA